MSTKKHILFVTRELVPYHYGGIGTLFKAQAKLLQKQGHEVSILTRAPSERDDELLKDNYGNADFYFVSARPEESFVDYTPSGGVLSSYTMEYAVAVERKFVEITKDFIPDVVISADFGAEGFFLFLQSRLLRQFTHTRFILHISGGLHEVLSAYQGQGGELNLPSELCELKNQLDCSLEESCIYLAGEVMVPTRYAWEQVSQRLAVNRKVEIVANILEKDLFGQGIGTNHTDDNLLLFVGRLDRVKGADLLLRFFLDNYQLMSRDMRLVMVGRDCFWKEYQSTFLEYWEERIPPELLEKITFTGQIDHDQVQQFLSRATLCLFPSRLEIFGNVCLEAMSFGIPCVVARNTGLSEILGDALSPYAIDFENEHSTILDIISSVRNLVPAKREQLRKLFRERFENVTTRAESDFLEFIQREKCSLNEDVVLPVETLYQRLFTAAAAMTDITYFLGNDIKQLHKYYAPDEKTYRQIVRGEITEKHSGTLRSAFARLCRKILKK